MIQCPNCLGENFEVSGDLDEDVYTCLECGEVTPESQLYVDYTGADADDANEPSPSEDELLHELL